MEMHTIRSGANAFCRTALVLWFGLTALTACGNANQPGASTPMTATSVTKAPNATSEPGATTATADTPLKVIATFSVLGDLVGNVAGDLVELKTLVPPGADAHTFEPSPADSVALAEAQVVFENGLEFESWLADLVTASGSQAERVSVSEGIDLIEATEGDHEEEGDHDEHAEETATAGEDEHGDEDEHGEFDPHVWHDVNNAIHMVERIRDGLAAADPANADTYRANADTYLQQLKDLDAFVVDRVDTLPAERRKLVTTHDTFGYFARRYGFEIVGTTLGSVSTEVADPSAADIVALVEQIKAVGVPTIFSESIEGGSVTERIAREAGDELAPTLYTDALGEPGSDGETYERMMRYNVETMVMALSK